MICVELVCLSGSDLPQTFSGFQDFQAQLYHLSLFPFQSHTPTTHPEPTLFLFIHGLQQVGQVTAQVNHRIRKWTRLEAGGEADIQAHFALDNSSGPVGKILVWAEPGLKFTRLASTENRVGFKEKRPQWEFMTM